MTLFSIILSAVILYTKKESQGTVPVTLKAGRIVLPAIYLGFSVIEGIFSDISHILVVYDLFGGSDEKETAGLDRCEELPEDFILSLIGEIDEYIPAYDHIVIGIVSVLEKIVLAEGYALLDLVGDLVGRTNLSEILLFEIIGYA